MPERKENQDNSQATEKLGQSRMRKLPRHWKFACAAVLAFGLVVGRSAAGNREHEDRDVWFVHATDPHLFLKAVDEKKDAEAAEKKKRQEELNRKALTDMLKRIRSLPGGEGPSTFLVLTGDLGIDPCEIPKSGNQSVTASEEGTPRPGEPQNGDKQRAKDKRSAQDCVNAFDTKKRKEQIEKIAELLGESPVPNIYLVAGNNDIAKESAGDEALKYFNDFIDDVQKELIKNKSSVVLHNLTRCYASGEAPSACYADIDGADYRLIGFPSYSFKSAKDEVGLDHNQAQGKQFETFRQLLEQAHQAKRKILVVTHTPEMDDPFALAQQRYVNPRSTPTATPIAPTATATPAETPTPAGTATPAQKKTKAQTQTDKSSSVATWKVSEQLLNDWKEVVASESLVGVFAGHLHDSHKEIYRRPYAWSSGSPAAFRKLFLAPPLAVKNQDTSPIQARGFSLVHLQPDRIESRLFWYDSETRAFTSDSKPKPRCERRGFWRKCCEDSRAAIRWLWNLDTANALERMAVLLIAFLTAFLTIVAIWQIPPPDDPFPEVKKAAPGETKPAQPTVNAPSDSSPFSSRFGKTVIAGLAGLIAAEVTKALGNQQPSPNTRWFYIVWFILFFFLLLLSLNLWRALVEALRSRFAIIYYPLPRPPEPVPDPQSKDKVRWPGRFWRWLVYRFYAGLHWLKSWLGVPLLTFADTFISLIQGKNQTTTKVFSDKIVDQQRNVLRVAKEIREQLNSVILGYLQDKTGKRIDPKDVRVNVSVLSADRTNVFYISKTRDSSRLSFPKRSVAWLSVFTGKIRWHKRSYDKGDLSKKIILFDNSAGTIPEEVPQIPLNSYYQPRGGEDYEAFVVFPVPLSQRGLDSDYVKGAIHVSFSRETHFDLVWSFICTPEEARAKATEEVDAKIKVATPDSERQRLQQSRLADIEAAVKAANPPICDPVLDKLKYQSEQRMLTIPWCTDTEVRGTLNTSLRVLGEVLRGFNEQIYKSIAKSEQAD